ncbi:hypothetical protein AAHB34_16000 [Paenarthrobacter ureafaciens]
MSNYPDEFDKLHQALVADAKTRPEYQNPAAISGYSEGAEHALDSIRLKGYTKPSNEQAAAVKAVERIAATMDEFYRSGSPENQFKALSEISAALGAYNMERI